MSSRRSRFWVTRTHTRSDSSHLGLCGSSTASVRGSLVHGLTSEDLSKLAVFEGDEYALRNVEVSVLGGGEAVGVKEARDLVLSEEVGKMLGSGKKVGCRTFVWVGGAARLEKGKGEWE